MDARTVRLNKQFKAIVHGRTPLTRVNNSLFVEAIYSQVDHVATIQHILGSQAGLSCVKQCLTFDTSLVFMNTHAAKLLRYFASQEVENVGSGKFIQPVVEKIIEDKVFWTAFLNSFREGKLGTEGQFGFAWLLLQLISSTQADSKSYLEIAGEISIINALVSAEDIEVRGLGQKIKHILALLKCNKHDIAEGGPGGRHDNDFVDFREINIFPTADELRCKEPPFLRPSSFLEDNSACTVDERPGMHLDNQFRLLREDMIYEMREELQIACGERKGKHRGLWLRGLTLGNLYTYTQDQSQDQSQRKVPWGITLKCKEDPWKGMRPKDRKTFLENNRNILRHQTTACLFVDGNIVAFPTIHRDESLLSKVPPIVVIQFNGAESTKKAFRALHRANDIKLLLIDTATFSYEPILKALQEKLEFPVAAELLCWAPETEIEPPKVYLKNIVEALQDNHDQNLKDLLRTTKSIILDEAQAESLLTSLTQRVSLIQGPPGTGKSFIGALLAKVIHDRTKQTILVVCYTNHALDQFLEELLDIGIPPSSMVRLGGKSNSRTEALSLQKQGPGPNLRKLAYLYIDSVRSSNEDHLVKLRNAYLRYTSLNLRKQLNVLLEYLEFEHPDYYQAFQLPATKDGMQRVGRKGREITPDYLIFRWLKGMDAGIFKNSPSVQEAQEIWSTSKEDRKREVEKWEEERRCEIIDEIICCGQQYNDGLAKIERKFMEKNIGILNSKRIIGCTTTGAAKYRSAIQGARPDVLLVEEAGEILESHILTAMSAETSQLILIGDHKQLRPKVNNYLLTVEKGEGYDLNRSMFERLVLKGFPHKTLRMQHRMRPEISMLVKELTYPELLDAPKTMNRPSLRGVQADLVFVDHDHPEDEDAEFSENRDFGAKSSKRNRYEAVLILKIVRYLAQQGYSSEDIVVLTPYLGQLRTLRDLLKETNDPVLNDMDTHDLVKAGLLSPAAAKMDKKPLRLATIDNYQGEESDIVIISLTRSNPRHDIGFMCSPQRLNVLLSRARNAQIIVGSSTTFLNSKKGEEIWRPLFRMLKDKGYMFHGFPIFCERHPQRKEILVTPDDFDKYAPDGGCTEPCSAMLSCNLHICPSKCHQLSDHSKINCKHIMYFQCAKGHKQQYQCYKKAPASCRKCDEQAEREAKRKQEEFEHARQIDEINAEIARIQREEKDKRDAEERKNALLQKLKDLENMKLSKSRKSFCNNGVISPTLSPSTVSEELSSTESSQDGGSAQAKQQPAPKLITPLSSPAGDEWEIRKRQFNEDNSAIDDIMAMTGLEGVKKQVLGILDKIQTVARQGSDVSQERFNVAMLGNPGTGKTTVARLYGKFLASVQVIPNATFEETTGSRLGNDGVPGLKKLLEKMLEGDGGVLFIDEAYQLADEKKVLDFLLAELENYIGKIVFIFAGYDREMEKFFEHNPGLPSRVPYRLQFKDYEDPELLDMLERLIDKKWHSRMKIEGGGIRGLYGRITIRRLGCGRGTPGFGNARALHNLLDRISERQSGRISKKRREGKRPDDFFMTKEDLIGPEPAKVMQNNKAWEKLQSMIGLIEVKNTVANMFSRLQINYKRELEEKKPHAVSLNRVFLGSPGTGKTTVAKLYGQILADLGLLSHSEVVVKNPADFIGAHLGESEKNTKGILAATIGKVLVIDEAYMLYAKTGSGGSGNHDFFKTAVIDTIVAEVQSVPGEDRCVLLLGYKEHMEEMFQNVNPGLARRFAIENAFKFEDYTDAELMQALEWKLKDQDLTATESAKTVALDVLSRMRNRPNFGNIGEVENLLSKAKLNYQRRQSALPAEKQSASAPFEPADFDPDFDRSKDAAKNLEKLFEDVVGAEEIVKKLRNWQIMAKNLKDLGRNMRKEIPTTFIFKGPPGTGKTTTARKIGQVYYDMGFLASTEVIECSASDLIGEYVGQTGPRTKKMFGKALGRVLFIDEAYRLREGHFAQEAIDELVGILTQEQYQGKLLVILAGYDQEMNDLLATNPGLSSRFPEEVYFYSMSPEQCLQILKNKLEQKKIRVACLDDPLSSSYKEMAQVLTDLAALSSWGNARDMETLAKKIGTVVLSRPLGKRFLAASKDGWLSLSDDDAVKCLDELARTKFERETNLPSSGTRKLKGKQPVAPRQPPLPPPPPPTTSSSVTQQKKKQAPPVPQVEDSETTTDTDGDPQRDAGVSDQVWAELQKYKLAEKRDLEERERAYKEAARVQNAATKHILEAEQKVTELEKKVELDDDGAERAELMRQRELARLAAVEARLKRDEAERARKLEEEKRKEEAMVQRKIRQMGVCVAGYRWIKQPTGYRCAGGSHWLSNEQLGIV